MQRIDKNGSALKISLLALAIVAVAGCSSSGSSSQPIDQDDPGQTDGGGTDGGSDNGDSGSGGGGSDGGGGQDFTYRTITPVDAIPVGEVFSLDSVRVNGTPSGSIVVINQQPALDHQATIEVRPNASNGDSIIRLNAPAAGVENTDFTEGGRPDDFYNGEDNDLKLRSMDEFANQFLAGSLNYAVFGEWQIRNSGGDTDASFFTGGYDTHQGDMPTTGTASYTGAARGGVLIDNGISRELNGQANLYVDFANRSLNGSLTNMTAFQYETEGTDQPWNNVNLAGGLDDTGNRFAGIAEVISTPGNAASLSTDAEGEFRGRFYGPGAAEAAAVWSLKDPNGNAAWGAFGVKKD